MNFLLFESSLTGLFRLVMILLAIYIVYSFITRYIIPALMRNYINNFQQRFFDENPGLREKMQQKKEGEITIESAVPNPLQHRQNNDEYIDYEEVK